MRYEREQGDLLNRVVVLTSRSGLFRMVEAGRHATVNKGKLRSLLPGSPFQSNHRRR